jgi:pilus assembly protein CpaC
MKTKLFFSSTLIMMLVTGACLWRAIGADDTTEEIKLYIGESKVIGVSNPTRVVIGNPSVADVVTATTKEITVSPKTPGETNLVVWDNFGEQSYRVKVFAENMESVKHRIDNLFSSLDFPEVYTRTAEDEGKVLLLGRLKYPQERERMILALGPLKDKVVDLIEVKEEEEAVEIDVQLLEVDKGSSSALGLTWPASVNLTESVASPALARSALAQIGTLQQTQGGDILGAKWSTLFKVVSGGRDAFTLKLDALIQEGKARILSRPRLSCQSGKEAELLVGGEVPIFTTQIAGSSGAAGNNIEYKEYGIKLKIKPNVTQEKRIKLSVNVEVSEIGQAEILGPANAPTAKAYPLTKRNASTQLFLNDGESMAIGGLMRQKLEETIRKIPVLGDIPLIGGAFRQKTTLTGGDSQKKENTELFIILTPKRVFSKQDKEDAVRQNKKLSAVSAASVPAETQVPSSPVSSYAAIIKTKILSKLIYPASAKTAGFQGTVRLKVHLNFNGELIEAVVDGSSGYRVLDDNALAVAKEVSAYPPFPPSVEQKDIWVTVPITYQLD